MDLSFWVKFGPGVDYIFKDLPPVLILIVADQILNESKCCSNKYNWCLCRFIAKTIHSALNIPDKFVWDMFNVAWNNLDLI